MWLIDRIVEQRVQEASERGELDDLPGAGRPLELEDDALVPEELRAGYRLLKNAGYLPPEMAVRKEIEDVEQLLARLDHGAERDEAVKRLRLLLDRLHHAGRSPQNLAVQQEYYQALLHKLENP